MRAEPGFAGTFAVMSHPGSVKEPPILAAGRRCSPIDLEVEIASHDPWTIVRVTGEIDLFTAPKLREQLLTAAGEGEPPDLLVDLTQVTFMDSTGLGVLIGALRRSNERDGHMALACAQGPVLRVIELTRLNEVFSLFSSVDDALASR